MELSWRLNGNWKQNFALFWVIKPFPAARWLAGCIDWFPKLKSSEREINVVRWCGGMLAVKMSPLRQILWSSVPVMAFPHTHSWWILNSIPIDKLLSSSSSTFFLCRHGETFSTVPRKLLTFSSKNFLLFQFSIPISNKPRISCEVNEIQL